MLTCLSELPFTPHDYQIQTAHKVLYEMALAKPSKPVLS